MQQFDFAFEDDDDDGFGALFTQQGFYPQSAHLQSVRDFGDLFNQDGFLPEFIGDLERAAETIEILSGFLNDRNSHLIDLLHKCVRKGVITVVYTRPAKDPLDEQRIERLRGCGVNVLTKLRMHQKIAIVDSRICWEGSLNILSDWGFPESMRRIVSSDEVEKHRRLHGLHHPRDL
jgi:hypothetical protein